MYIGILLVFEMGGYDKNNPPNEVKAILQRNQKKNNQASIENTCMLLVCKNVQAKRHICIQEQLIYLIANKIREKNGYTMLLLCFLQLQRNKKDTTITGRQQSLVFFRMHILSFNIHCMHTSFSYYYNSIHFNSSITQKQNVPIV